MDSDESPQLKGVVIITLPPPDNPSLGKTITAFTLTDDSPPSYHTQQQQDQEEERHLPIQLQPPQNPQLEFSLPRLFPGFPGKLFLGISLFALVLYASVFSYTLEERFNSKDEREQKKSFILPLYHKFGMPEVLQGDIELKLGRFVDLDKENIIAPINDGILRPKKSKISKMSVSTNAAVVDSSSTFPVRGNVYPDGYV